MSLNLNKEHETFIPKYFNLETVKLILIWTQLSSLDKECDRATCFDPNVCHSDS
jgi:hypothetical protein